MVQHAHIAQLIFPNASAVILLVQSVLSVIMVSHYRRQILVVNLARILLRIVSIVYRQLTAKLVKRCSIQMLVIVSPVQSDVRHVIIILFAKSVRILI